jgi:hypothetical protein
MLVVIALLASSATAAQAGSGGVPSVLTSFFVCKSIGGDNPGSISGDESKRRVDVDSTDPAGWGFNLPNVRLGNATLACAFARLFRGGTTNHIPCDPRLPPNPNCNEIDPRPGDLATAGTQLKCYAVSVNRSQASASPPPTYEVLDAFGTDSNVDGSSVQYVCGPARFLEKTQ